MKSVGDIYQLIEAFLYLDTSELSAKVATIVAKMAVEMPFWPHGVFYRTLTRVVGSMKAEVTWEMSPMVSLTQHTYW
jgi:hypothetical protein